MCKVPGRSGSIFAEDSAFVAAKCAVDVPDRISVLEIGDFSGSAKMNPSVTAGRRLRSARQGQMSGSNPQCAPSRHAAWFSHQDA